MTIDVGNLPRRVVQDVFKTPTQDVAPATQTVGRWVHWAKPRGVAWVHILCIGGGGGGGGGFTRAAGAAGGGGGSGGSSGHATICGPASLFPDILYVQVGYGGAGVASGGGTAGAGIVSTVAIQPRNTIANSAVLIRSGNNGATGGGTGTGAAAGAAGTAGSVVTIAQMPLGGPFQPFFVAGSAGVLGGAPAGAVGINATFPTTGAICSGGSGGAGTTAADFAGGGYVPTTDSLLSDYAPKAAAAGSNPGSSGFALWPPNAPLFFYGGLGGSSSNTLAGGAGGFGSYGAGGGGGGAGTTGGRGGNGGPGIVIFTCW